MIAYIAKLLKTLNANTNPSEIAHGAACGVILGLMPKDNLLWYFIFIFLLFIRINKSFYFIMIFVASALTPLLDPTFDSLGYSVLTIQSLYNTYSSLLNIPFVAFTKFNNTIVMGSLIAGLIAYIPVYIVARILVKLWRKHGVELLRKSKIIQAIKHVPIVSKIVDLVGDNI